MHALNRLHLVPADKLGVPMLCMLCAGFILIVKARFKLPCCAESTITMCRVRGVSLESGDSENAHQRYAEQRCGVLRQLRDGHRIGYNKVQQKGVGLEFRDSNS